MRFSASNVAIAVLLMCGLASASPLAAPQSAFCVEEGYPCQDLEAPCCSEMVCEPVPNLGDVGVSTSEESCERIER